MQVMKSLRSQTEGSERIQKEDHQSLRLGSQREDACYWCGDLGHTASLVGVSGGSWSHAGDATPADTPHEAEREGERYLGFSLLPSSVSCPCCPLAKLTWKPGKHNLQGSVSLWSVQGRRRDGSDPQTASLGIWQDWPLAVKYGTHETMETLAHCLDHLL